MVTQTEVILRRQLEANPEVVGPWPISLPQAALLIENNGQENAVVNIAGGDEIGGPFYSNYGSDTGVDVVAGGRTIVLVSDVVKYMAIFLTTAVPDGVKVTIVSFSGPGVGTEVRRVSL